jgi:hypothetical protein
MVEIGDGLDQTTAWEVRNEGLEGSKGLGRLESLIGVADDVMAGRAFDEDVAAAGSVCQPRPAFVGTNVKARREASAAPAACNFAWVWRQTRSTFSISPSGFLKMLWLMRCST